jgi:TldD protein
MIVNDSILGEVIHEALARGADFAEVYLEDSRRREYSFLSQRPERAISGHALGAGIRLFAGTEMIYTYTNDISREGLLRAARQAAAALKAGTPHTARPAARHEVFGRTLATPSNGDAQWDGLRAMDQAARQVSSLITQVDANLSETVREIQVFNSEGVHRTESRNYLVGRVVAVSEDGGIKESGMDRTGFLGTHEDWQKVNFSELGANAAAQSLRILKADWATAGEMPVIVANSFGGVIFHEACGHGLETTAIAADASVFCGKLGEKVAHESVTAIDDGTIEGQYGSLEMDDEGESTQRTVLIEKGILKSYIVDKMGARKTGYAVTGSGRRQDYRYAPASRMRNTFIAAGNSSFEEMIKDVDYGLYAETLGGGSVNPATGSYNFAVQEGYLVRNGRIEKQVKGASLIGTGIETLGRIAKVGSDLKLSAGTCGSVSGMIPTTVGQPAILVSKLTVGGKA